LAAIFLKGLFDESAAKIEGGHDSWLAEVVVEGRRRVGGEGEGEGRRRVGGEGEGRRRVVVGGRR
jgi:hypothetical protein